MNLSSDIATRGKEYLVSTFLPPYKDYNVIIGYRADDSYFASAFLNSTISLAQFEQAMSLEKRGEQVVLKSEQDFSHLHFEENIPAERTIIFRVVKEAAVIYGLYAPTVGVVGGLVDVLQRDIKPPVYAS
ncbi:DUF3990 domain-containing protein [Pseudoflavonifractor sp. AF19-9AC]|nr:DUF3990 domain-containing protein [Pseudoflavonifractor sp. AF19-9AC]